MSDICRVIAEKIRGLRSQYRGNGINQDELAAALKTTANTISRWETAIYKPPVADLERMARFFGVPITVFFPQIETSDEVTALLSATGDLSRDDLKNSRATPSFEKPAGRSRRPGTKSKWHQDA
jgi:transcriptional regulator with XRE-family HTH domain